MRTYSFHDLQSFEFLFIEFYVQSMNIFKFYINFLESKAVNDDWKYFKTS